MYKKDRESARVSGTKNRESVGVSGTIRPQRGPSSTLFIVFSSKQVSVSSWERLKSLALSAVLNE
jgi:hypothetical protein